MKPISVRCWPHAAAAVLVALTFCSSAVAGGPVHPRLPELDIPGFDHACGAAVDSEGNVYVASSGQSTVKVFDPEHDELKAIANPNEPCGLAVDSKGHLYVVEKATGNVVRYTPDAYPLSGSPTYGAPQTIDASGQAKGISVDQVDDRLYVAEGNRIAVYQSDGTTGQNEIRLMEIRPMVVGGTYTLGFEGQSTAPIPYNATPAQVQSSLEAVPTIGAGNLAVEEGEKGTRSYRITFTHALGSKDLPSLESDDSGLVGAAPGFRIQFPGEQVNGFEFDGHIAEGELGNATAVAAFTYGIGGKIKRYIFAADSDDDEVDVISGAALTALSVTGTIDGKAVPDSPACPTCSDGFGFGPEGAALAVDWATGHLFVYDATHAVLDEFEAGGRYLDQTVSVEFADGGPTGIAVLPERSAVQEFFVRGKFALGFEGGQTPQLAGNSSAAQIQSALEALPAVGAGNVSVARDPLTQYNDVRVRFSGALADQHVGNITVALSPAEGEEAETFANRQPGYGPGRVYVTAGASADAKLLAFGPLATPSRPLLPGLSRVLKGAREVTTDSHGNVYVVTGALIRIFDPLGAEIKVGPGGKGIEDSHLARDLSVDSKGNLYVADAINNEFEVTYYTPSVYPPVDGTTYTRHEPPLVTLGSSPVTWPERIVANPANDHLLVAGTGGGGVVIELDSAANGSGFIKEIAPALQLGRFPSGIAVSSVPGDIYLGDENGQYVSIIDATGSERIASITGAGGLNGPLRVSLFAMDQSSGHVLTFVTFGSPNPAVQEFDAAGGFVGEFGNMDGDGSFNGIAIDNACAIHRNGSGELEPLTEATTPTCSEFDPANGNLYVATGAAVNAQHPFNLSVFGPLSYGEPPLATTGVASGVGGGGATLNGRVDPVGFDLTACRFEYLTDADYAANGNTFSGATSVPCAESLAAIGNGDSAVPVHVQISGLDPGARYRFRLVAASKYGTGEGSAALLGPPVVTTKPAVPVFYAEATLHGEVDPSGLASTYRFEYGTSEAYGQATPSEELAAGETPGPVKAEIAGLKAGTTYHFRLTAESEAGAVEGEDLTLTTLPRRAAEACPNAEFRTGLSANLPDCRAYELVTPAQTNGFVPEAAEFGSGSLELGFNNWLVSPRGAGAGERLSYFSAGTLPGFDGNGLRDGYRAVRAPGAHPEAGWENELVGPTFQQAVPDWAHGVSQQGVASDQLYSVWRVDPAEGEGALEPGVYLRTPSGFEAVGQGELGTDMGAEARYVSPGGSHVIFPSRAHLEPEAAPAGTAVLYDRASGDATAQVVSLKPDGSAFGSDATYVGSTEDGAGVVFRVAEALYLRHEGQTTEIAAAPNRFAGISGDGKRVFYAATTPRNTPLPSSIYFCDVEDGSCAGPEAGQEPTLIAPNAIFVAVSPDGSRVFFTSEEAIAGAGMNENCEEAGGEAVCEEAEPGAPNLYAWGPGANATSFIARLADRDLENMGFVDGVVMNLIAWTQAINPGAIGGFAQSPVRTTPDGNVFVFQSHARLTDYDNDGKGEIYRYDPANDEGEGLVCVSCNPAGAPAIGTALLEDHRSGSGPVATTIIANLTDDGQEVFFQSPDRLLPEDANDAVDVYRWKAKGTGDCARAGGCLALISSGQGELESTLYGMSASGRDVFFLTSDKLVGADLPGTTSIYDARVEGGIPDAAAEAPCRGDACQGSGTVPPVVPVPGSAAVGGQDDVVARACGKGRRQVRKGGKTRCIKRVKKHRHKSRRAHHNGRSHR